MDFGAPLLFTWCTGCHSSAVPEKDRRGAPLTVNLDALENVRALRDRVFARAADAHKTMPPAGGISDDDRLLLGDWLACGAP